MSPTLDQLQQEVYWGQERVPAGLISLRARLMERLVLGFDAIGTIGDEHHLNGYHRSRAWILNSQYCTNRTYSVTETDGNREGGERYYIAGMDILIYEEAASSIAARLRTGRAQGALPMVLEVRLESNPSHVHIGFDRGMVDHNLDVVYDWITGDAHQGQKMIEVHCVMPELRRGDSSDDVATAQTLANRRGESLDVDGEFGPLTDQAIRDVQTRYAANSVDGIVGPETWTILLAGKHQV